MRESKLRPLFAQLADECRADHHKAIGEMVAISDSPDPSNFIRWTVRSVHPHLEIPIEQHERLGGSGSAPCPGTLIAMALAACMDGTIRMIADSRGVELDSIHVEVVNRGDMRAIIGVADEVPEPADAGISMNIEVVPSPGQDRGKVARVLELSEASSAVLLMLRGGVPITTNASII
ncbi:MAG: OsmC family protein [Actinomycetota bacterium]